MIRGLLRGTIAQVFAFFGILLGVLAGSAVADWVGAHWRDAEPGIVFTALRWVVAILTGLGVSGLLQWWGELLAKAAHDGPFGWLDRLVGGAVGAVMGSIVCIAIVVFLLQAPGLGFARIAASRGVTVRPLIVAGGRVSEWTRRLPGGLWLHEQLYRASRRLAEAHGEA